MSMSKKKLDSYKRAEKVCRELRHQYINDRNPMDHEKLLQLLISWMEVTGKIKYERPDL